MITLRPARLALLLLALLLTSCATPRLGPRAWEGVSGEEGLASWYGHPYHGRRTSNGEVYDMYQVSAAHREIPLGSWARADLKPGDLIEAGHTSNYGTRKRHTYVYLTGTLDAAAWGAELALGEEPGRIYIVEPTSPIMDDPKCTDKKFQGNPTKSYRSREPLRVTGEVTDWQGHSPEAVQAMKDAIRGLEPIDD